MSSFDHIQIGTLRIEKERLQARLDERDRVDRLIAAWLDTLATHTTTGPWVRQNAARYADELRQTMTWDGCPTGDKGQPGARRRGAKP